MRPWKAAPTGVFCFRVLSEEDEAMNATCEWWEGFFHGPWGELQAKGYASEKTQTEAECIISTLGLAAGDEVLDVACGIGRHTLELAARSIRMTGIDFNGKALAIAAAAAAERGLDAAFVKSDMRCLRWRERFDAAYCFWTSFGYFEDEAHDLVAAKRIAEALKPDGRFLIDVHTTETLLPMFRQRHWEWLDESHSDRLLQDTHWNFETGRVEGVWTFIENGRSRSCGSSLRLYSYRELCELLREAGFSRFESYDTKTGSPFRLGSQRLSLVASL
jgi:SAM-dependent methyltransferase